MVVAGSLPVKKETIPEELCEKNPVSIRWRQLHFSISAFRLHDARGHLPTASAVVPSKSTLTTNRYPLILMNLAWSREKRESHLSWSENFNFQNSPDWSIFE